MVLNFPTSPINGQVSNDFYFDSSVGTEGAWRSSPVPIGGLPAGSIIQWAGATAPANWLIADGSAVSRTANASLFAVIGTTYGSGDGSTTFNLPDLRGRVAVGRDGSQTEFDALGETGGEKAHTLTVGELPHSSVIYTSNTNYYAGIVSGNAAQYSAKVHTNGQNSQTAFNNLQPYLVTNYIIKATAGWSAGDSELAQRVGVLEAAPAGLVRVVPTSVAVGGGTASVSSTGVVTFTNATNLALNGCFTSAYKNYRIVFRITATSAWLDAMYRNRASGTDAIDNTYWYAGSYQRSDVVGFGGSYNGNPQTQARLGAASTAAVGVAHGVYDIFCPQATEWTTGTGTLWGYQGGSAWHQVAFTHSNAGSFDGFDFFPSSGAFSGTIQVYGYRN